MWDLIVSVPDRCLSFYFDIKYTIACSINTCKNIKCSKMDIQNKTVSIKVDLISIKT